MQRPLLLQCAFALALLLVLVQGSAGARLSRLQRAAAAAAAAEAADLSDADLALVESSSSSSSPGLFYDAAHTESFLRSPYLPATVQGPMYARRGPQSGAAKGWLAKAAQPAWAALPLAPRTPASVYVLPFDHMREVHDEFSWNNKHDEPNVPPQFAFAPPIFIEQHAEQRVVAEADAEAEAEVDAEADMESEMEAEVEAEAEAEAEMEAEAEAEVEAETDQAPVTPAPVAPVVPVAPVAPIAPVTPVAPAAPCVKQFGVLAPPAPAVPVTQFGVLAPVAASAIPPQFGVVAPPAASAIPAQFGVVAPLATPVPCGIPAVPAVPVPAPIPVPAAAVPVPAPVTAALVPAPAVVAPAVLSPAAVAALVEMDVDAEVDVDADVESEAKADTEVDAETDADSEAEADAEAEMVAAIQVDDLASALAADAESLEFDDVLAEQAASAWASASASDGPPQLIPSDFWSSRGPSPSFGSYASPYYDLRHPSVHGGHVDARLALVHRAAAAAAMHPYAPAPLPVHSILHPLGSAYAQGPLPPFADQMEPYAHLAQTPLSAAHVGENEEVQDFTTAFVEHDAAADCVGCVFD